MAEEPTIIEKFINEISEKWLTDKKWLKKPQNEEINEVKDEQ